MCGIKYHACQKIGQNAIAERRAEKSTNDKYDRTIKNKKMGNCVQFSILYKFSIC
jgi:hypothetical protein